MIAQDLNPNIYYTRVYGGDTDIFMFPQKLYSSHFLRTTGSYPKYSRDYAVGDMEGIRLATPEEKHWLDVCIKKDTYVPRDIAMASFAETVTIPIYPAYVRCTHSGNSRFKKGNVYKTYPGLNIRGNVYLQPEEDLGFKPGISDYPLNGGLWTFEPCEGPETSSTTTPEAKTEVFGKFIIGNIVVSLRNNMPYREEGDMFTILPMSKQDILYYKPSTNSSDPGDWRLATTKECIAYHNGVKNIKQIEEPKEAITKQTGFLKDEYIVTTKVGVEGSFKTNHVFKQRENHEYLRAYKDCSGSLNGSSTFMFNDPSTWRYATKQEIMEYDIQNRPVNVTKIGMRPDANVIPSNAKKWAVRRTEANYKVLNHWANSQDNIASGHSSSGGWMHSINYGMSGHSKSGHYFADNTKHPDHTEISFEQFQREYLKSDPKINVEPVITKTMASNNWCVNLDGSEPQRQDIINYFNTLDSRCTMGGTGGYYYLDEDTRIRYSSHKPQGFREYNAKEFVRDIMNVSMSTPTQPLPVNSLPAQWHVLVDRDTIFDAQLWRWDGNRANYQLEIGQLVGVPEYGSKGHNPGRSPGIFGKQLSYSEFKKYVMTEAERTRLLLIKYPIGSCIVVTQERSNYNGKQNYCYKVCSIKATSDDPTVMYSPMNGIGIRTVGVRYATPEETARYEREGQPYDTTVKEIVVTSYDPNIFELVVPKTEVDPYAGKSMEEMLVICRQMFPKGCTFRKKGEVAVHFLDQDLIIQSAGAVANNERGISNIGLPWFFFNGTMRVERADAEIKCYSQEPTKTLKDLPKKATLSDVSALVKHQEPVIAFSKKAKRSKLVIINK